MQNRVFEGLNYSLGNEDCRVESDLLRSDGDHIVSVAISGAQLVPFLAKRPKVITLVDVSEAQLSLARLRLDLLKTQTFEAYLKYFGYAPYGATNDANALLLYAGKWEQTAIKLSRAYRAVLGQNALQLFECGTLAEQNAFLAAHFPMRRWKLVRTLVATLAGAASIIRPNEFPPGVKPTHFFREYKRIFSELLSYGLAKENFFLQMLVLGKIVHESANPPEAQRDVFESAKAWASQCEVRFVHGDAIKFLGDSPADVDFVALSNISSYFLGDLSTRYLQAIKPSLKSGAQVVVRNFLRNATKPNLEGFEDLTPSVAAVFDRECTRVYTMSLYRYH